MKFIRINLLTLLFTIVVYIVFLRARDSNLARALKTIPFFQRTSRKIFAEVGKEVLKIVGTYFLLQTLRVK